MIAASAGFFTYVMIMAQNGFFPSRLIGISRSWDAESVNDLLDSYGQEWTYDQRKALEYTCHSGFFISVVTVQIAPLIVCKTRKTSLFRQGFGNSQLNLALIIELLLALFLTYTPSINTTTTTTTNALYIILILFLTLVVRQTLQMYPLRPVWWMTSMVFSILLFIYDELRKLLMRKFPNSLGGWIEQETYS